MLPLNPSDWPAIVPSGGRAFIGSGAACPQVLMRSLEAEKARMRDVELVQILTLGPAPWVEETARTSFRTNAFFLGEQLRDPVNACMADYTPSFLSDVPKLFKQGVLPLDAALIMVSPPDAHGNCSLGVSVDVVKAAVQTARTVVAQINPAMPRTIGQSDITTQQIDYFIEAEEALPTWKPSKGAAVVDAVGAYVAQLVEDGSTLQLGIGNVPDSICTALKHHKHLGLHTEMFSDGVMGLIESGVLDNSRKSINTGQGVTSFCLGSEALYGFVHNNYHLSFRPTSYTNNIAVIAQHSNMVAVNSAVEVDLTGQATADTINGKFYSGIGGLVDFMRGAAMADEGMPILALPSTACNGEVSRIVAQLSPGAGVVCSRADVHYVVTEYGIATLRGRSIRERVLELVQVAHPKFRDALMRFAHEHNYITVYECIVPYPIESNNGLTFEKVTLANKPYVLRPLHSSDERRLQEFFYSHDDDTIHRRYGYGVKEMGAPKAHQLAGVDQTRDLALGIFETQGPRQQIHAIGRYFLDDDGCGAECAFVVRETKRCQGMANLLLDSMIRIARKRKLDFLWAMVASDNKAMITVFVGHGAQRTESCSDTNHVRVEIKLSD